MHEQMIILIITKQNCLDVHDFNLIDEKHPISFILSTHLMSISGIDRVISQHNYRFFIVKKNRGLFFFMENMTIKCQGFTQN